jgi:hypothetical protein
MESFGMILDDVVQNGRQIMERHVFVVTHVRDTHVAVHAVKGKNR